MYRLHYEIDDNDYFSFNKYSLETSPAGKRTLRVYRLVLPFICLMFLLVFFMAKAAPGLIITEAIVLAVLSILWVVFAKKLYLYSMRRSVNKMRKQGKVPYAPEGTLIFDEEYICDINPIAETKTRYESIERMGIADTAIYLFFNVAQAYLVPYTCFENENERQDFTDFITSRLNAASAPQR